MKGVFDDEDLKPSRAKGDTELTLGTWALLGIFFAIVVVCGVCFGVGYTLGSRGAAKGPVFQSQPPAAGPAPQMPANSPQGKPSAAAQPPQAPQPMDATQQISGTVPGATPGAVPGAPSATASTTGPTTGSSILGAGTSTVTPDNSGWQRVQPGVQPAMQGAAGASQAAQPSASNGVRPAMPGSGSIMVQIAAVSDQQDANVLLGALRRRGYAASEIRYPADNLIHVCIGPFSNRNDADSMREKLLSDGYNAIVLQ